MKIVTPSYENISLDYGSNNLAALERRSKGDIVAFVNEMVPNIPVNPKMTKKQLIRALVDAFGESAVETKFKSYRIDEKFKIADQYLVDIKNLTWDPAEMVVANLQRMDSHDIVVDGTKIQHECDGWRFSRPKFCVHLLALFIEISNRYPEQTLKWSQKIGSGVGSAIF